MEILILIALAVGLFYALRYIKRHPTSCGGNCSCCDASCKHKDV